MSIFSCGKAEPDEREELPDMTSKVVVVGDGAVGKTSLLTRFVNDHYDETYVATIFDNQASCVTVRNKRVRLNLFDTAGQETYEHLRPLMYPNTDIILVCFAINNPGSLRNVIELWQPEVRAHLAKAPILLLGLKDDLRASRDSDGNENGSHAGRGCRLSQEELVTKEEATNVANTIGAKAYFECSAKTNDGVSEIFQEAGRLSLKIRRRSATIRDILFRKSTS